MIEERKCEGWQHIFVVSVCRWVHEGDVCQCGAVTMDRFVRVEASRWLAIHDYPVGRARP
jgi:hypothetical protein